MAINLTTQPRATILAPAYYSYFHAAYNPAAFVFTLSAIPAGATSLKVDVEILDKAGTTVSTHEAFAFQLVAWLMVEDIVQSIITDQSTYAENSFLNDGSLYAEYYVKYRDSYYTSGGVLTQGAWTTSHKYFAVRGAFQIPDIPNYYQSLKKYVLHSKTTIYSSTGELLTMFNDEIIPCWPGYPRDIALILADFSDSLVFRRNLGGVLTSTNIPQDGVYPGFVCRMELSTNSGHTYPWTTVYVTNVAGDRVCSRVYTLDKITVGNNPFYVRWRNPLGGFDYWMFEKRQEITYASSDTKSAKRDLSLFGTARSTHKVYSRKGSLGYLVGATNLTQVRWEALNSIQFSNCVEYWDGTNWLEIYPEDNEQQLINDKPAGEIEYLFFFPERQLSF